MEKKLGESLYKSQIVNDEKALEELRKKALAESEEESKK